MYSVGFKFKGRFYDYQTKGKESSSTDWLNKAVYLYFVSFIVGNENLRNFSPFKLQSFSVIVSQTIWFSRLLWRI